MSVFAAERRKDPSLHITQPMQLTRMAAYGTGFSCNFHQKSRAFAPTKKYTCHHTPSWPSSYLSQVLFLSRPEPRRKDRTKHNVSQHDPNAGNHLGQNNVVHPHDALPLLLRSTTTAAAAACLPPPEPSTCDPLLARFHLSSWTSRGGVALMSRGLSNAKPKKKKNTQI